MATTITVNPIGALSGALFASQTSFQQKLLNFRITLAQQPANNQPNVFPDTQSNTINLTGHRARCRITNAQPPAGATADIAIYGLSQSSMDTMATLGLVGDSIAKATIFVSAGATTTGDASAATANLVPAAGFPVVFAGTFQLAYGDYNEMPDVPFRIIAQSGLINAVVQAPPTSYTKPTPVATIMQGIASQIGVAFENNGVTATLANPYYPGTLLQQAYQVAYHTPCNVGLVDGGTKLAIWPIAGSRTSQTAIPLISPSTGMIGYPSFAATGFLVVRMLFNPSVIFGGQIKVQSSIPQANKVWDVMGLDYVLDTLFPGGEWTTIAFCRAPGAVAAAPGKTF